MSIKKITKETIIEIINNSKSYLYNIYSIDNLINKNKDKIKELKSYNFILDDYINNNQLQTLSIYSIDFEDINKTEWYISNKEDNVSSISDTPLFENIYIKDIETIQNSKSYSSIDIQNWINGIQLSFKLYRKDLLDDSKYIVINDILYLNNFVENSILNTINYMINDIDLSENKIIKNITPSRKFISFISEINKIISLYDKISGTIFEFGPLIEFNNLKCILSDEYPYMEGQYIKDCFIKGSNQNYPQLIYNLMKDIHNNNINIYENSILLSSFQLEGEENLGIIRFIIIAEKLCIQIEIISISSIFLSDIVTKDEKIIGKFEVNTLQGESLIKTDNLNKIITLHNKVGINQKEYEIKGLLDIDNLGTRNIVDLFLDIINPILKNNNIFNDILNKNQYSIPEYKNEYVLVEFPIKTNLEKIDISFLYRPENNIFNTDNISNSLLFSLNKISNEISRMKEEIKNKNDYLFTFLELVNDDNYYFLCSYRGKIKNTKLLLSITFMNINELMIDKSYKENIEKILFKFSGINKFLNYSGLLLHNKEIQKELLLNRNSVSSISKIINEGIFKDRFKIDNLYLSSFNIDNTITLFDEERPSFNGSDNRIIWIGENNQYEIISNILNFYRKNYGELKENINLPIWYIDNNIPKFIFINCITIGDKTYFYKTGISLDSLIDPSVLTKGNIDIFGDLTINNPDSSIIFKVDSKRESIVSNYNIGIGIDNTKSLLEIKGIELTDIILFLNIQNNGINIMNNIYEKLEKVEKEEDMIKIMNQVSIQNYNQYFSITKVDLVNSNNNKLIYHFLFPRYSLKTFEEILEENINLRELLLLIKNNIQNILNNNFFFRHSTIFSILDSLSGKQLYSIKILYYKDNFYILSFNQNMKNFSKNIYNNNMELFFNRLSFNNKILSNVILELLNIPIPFIINYKNGLSLLKKELQIYDNDITIFSYKYNRNDFINSFISTIEYPSLEKGEYININSIENLNQKSKYISFILNFTKFYQNNFREGSYGILSYEDNKNDFIGNIYNLKETEDEYEIIVVELNYQGYINPSIKVDGDVKIKGDLIIENTELKTNFFNVDPRTKYIGVNNDNRFINYSNDNYFTTSSILNSKHQVHISRDTYPNLVCSRIAENKDDIENKNYNLFSNYSGSTLKRKSNLYSFQEMIDYTKEGNELNNYNSWEEKRYYGVDISYEVEDNSGSTKEIGQVAMSIENIDETGYIRGGWGVSVVDKDDNSFKQRSIVHVNNSGIMDINGIRLGGKILKVNEKGDLIWGDKKVKLECI